MQLNSLMECARERGYSARPSSNLDLVIETVQWVDETLKREKWTTAQFRELYGRRSPLSILTEGSTDFYANCIDSCSVAGQLCHEMGIPTQMELYESAVAFQPLYFHTRLNVTVSGSAYGVSMGRYGSYYFDYNEARHKKNKQIHAVTFDAANVPILERFVEGGIDDIGRLIKGYNHWLFITFMRLTHTKWKYQRVQRQTHQRKETLHQVKVPIPAKLSFK